MLPFAVLLLLGVASAQQSTNYFIWPPRTPNANLPTYGGDFADNPSMTGNETFNFRTNYTSYTVDLYQNVLTDGLTGDPQFVKTVNNHITGDAATENSVNTTFNWPTSTYNTSESGGDVFFFWIQNADDPSQEQFFMSHYFNLTHTDDETASTTAASVTSATSAAATSLATDAPSTTDSGSASVIGIALGVGLGVGIPIVLLLALLIYLRHRKNKSSFTQAGDEGKSELSSSSSSITNSKEARSKAYEVPNHAVHEASGGKENTHEVPDHAVHEAPGDGAHEVPDHAIVEAPGDLKVVEAMERPRTPVELPEARSRPVSMKMPEDRPGGWI